MATKEKKQLSPQEKQKLDGERKLKKAAKFRELAGKRVSKALHALKQVERLANKNSYVYTPDQVKRIMEALQTAGRNMQSAFTKSPDAPKAQSFDVGE